MSAVPSPSTIADAAQRPIVADWSEDDDPALPLPALHRPVVDLTAEVLPDDIGGARLLCLRYLNCQCDDQPEAAAQ